MIKKIKKNKIKPFYLQIIGTVVVLGAAFILAKINALELFGSIIPNDSTNLWPMIMVVIILSFCSIVLSYGIVLSESQQPSGSQILGKALAIGFASFVVFGVLNFILNFSS